MKEAGPTPNENIHSSEHVAEPRPGSAEAPPAPDYVPSLNENRVDTMRWLLTGPPELAGYAGKWVVLANRRVCAAADAADEAIAKADQAGVPASDTVLHFVEDVARVYDTAQP